MPAGDGAWKDDSCSGERVNEKTICHTAQVLVVHFESLFDIFKLLHLTFSRGFNRHFHAMLSGGHLSERSSGSTLPSRLFVS